jgi:hypothetical protein
MDNYIKQAVKDAAFIAFPETLFFFEDKDFINLIADQYREDIFWMESQLKSFPEIRKAPGYPRSFEIYFAYSRLTTDLDETNDVLYNSNISPIYSLLNRFYDELKKQEVIQEITGIEEQAFYKLFDSARDGILVKMNLKLKPNARC